MPDTNTPVTCPHCGADCSVRPGVVKPIVGGRRFNAAFAVGPLPGPDRARLLGRYVESIVRAKAAL